VFQDIDGTLLSQDWARLVWIADIATLKNKHSKRIKKLFRVGGVIHKVIAHEFVIDGLTGAFFKNSNRKELDNTRLQHNHFETVRAKELIIILLNQFIYCPIPSEQFLPGLA
jgi:hypothetical protein